MTFFGAFTPTRQEPGRSSFSTARTTRTCWSPASTSSSTRRPAPGVTSIFAISRPCSPNPERRSSNSSSTSARRSSSTGSRNAWMIQRATGKSANPIIQSANCGMTTSTRTRMRSAPPARMKRRGTSSPRTTSGSAISWCHRSSPTPWPISTSPSRRRRSISSKYARKYHAAVKASEGGKKQKGGKDGLSWGTTVRDETMAILDLFWTSRSNQ